MNSLKRFSSRTFLYTAIAFVFLGALFLRFYMLNEKPPHHDESINGWFILQMWKNGFFRYDPSNYHGPLLFYLFQLAEVLCGDSIWTLRAVVSLFSFLTVVFFCLRSLRESKYWLLGVMVLLFSPGAAFFGRSAIHEAVLVFTFVIVLWSLEDLQNRLIPFAVALACAFSLKETTAILCVAAVVAIAISRFRPLTNYRTISSKIVKAFLVFFLIIVILFTGFFQNPHGFLDFFVAYLPWLKTGVGGGGHDKPFYFWAELILKYEQGTAFLALVGVCMYPFVTSRERFFIILSWLHFLFFSLIPYKTPWCLLSIQLPFVYSTTLGIANFRVRRFEFIGGVLLVAACGFGWKQMIPIVYQHPLDLKHPFVYVQTEYAFKNIINFLDLNEGLLRNKSIYILNSEAWPLPWWLRHYNLVYGGHPLHFSTDYDIVFVDSSVREQANKIYGADYWSQEFKTRDARESALIYIRKSLFQIMVPLDEDVK